MVCLHVHVYMYIVIIIWRKKVFINTFSTSTCILYCICSNLDKSLPFSIYMYNIICTHSKFTYICTCVTCAANGCTCIIILGGFGTCDISTRVRKMKEDLMRGIEELAPLLPSNSLDQLIDGLGGPEYVSEVSATLY